LKSLLLSIKILSRKNKKKAIIVCFSDKI